MKLRQNFSRLGPGDKVQLKGIQDHYMILRREGEDGVFLADKAENTQNLMLIHSSAMEEIVDFSSPDACVAYDVREILPALTTAQREKLAKLVMAYYQNPERDNSAIRQFIASHGGPQ